LPAHQGKLLLGDEKSFEDFHIGEKFRQTFYIEHVLNSVDTFGDQDSLSGLLRRHFTAKFVLQIGEDPDSELFSFVYFVPHYERDVLQVQFDVLVAIFLWFQLLSELLNIDIFLIELQVCLSRID